MHTSDEIKNSKFGNIFCFINSQNEKNVALFDIKPISLVLPAII